MIGMLFGLMARIFIIWPLMLINAFIGGYIEYFDAILVGGSVWALTQMCELMSWQWGIVVGVVVAIIFLVLFHHSQMAMWIFTVLCSLLWASWLVAIVTWIFPDNRVAYWIGFALIFSGCIWLHHLAKSRPAIQRELAAEEKAAQLRASGYETPEEIVRREKEYAQWLQKAHEREEFQELSRIK